MSRQQAHRRRRRMTAHCRSGLGEDEVTQMMGIGYLGEVRQGPDGNLYQ